VGTSKNRHPEMDLKEVRRLAEPFSPKVKILSAAKDLLFPD
jgi:hypothetical protein